MVLKWPFHCGRRARLSRFGDFLLSTMIFKHRGKCWSTTELFKNLVRAGRRTEPWTCAVPRAKRVNRGCTPIRANNNQKLETRNQKPIYHYGDQGEHGGFNPKKSDFHRRGAGNAKSGILIQNRLDHESHCTKPGTRDQKSETNFGHD